MTTRRAFLASLAAALPAAALVRHAHAASLADLATAGTLATLTALAETVLPSELGAAETARVVRDFQHWIAGYRPGAELLHGYGTSRLEYAGPTPATRWMTQLDGLDAAARRTDRQARSFAALPMQARRTLVQQQLDDMRATRIPAVGAAPHVALALLGHYYGSTEANDRCYRASIGRQTCRPLSGSPRKPLPLYGAGA